MSELVEFDCARSLRDDEEARARIEADIQHDDDIAEREEWAERQAHERDRRWRWRRGREYGRDVDWTP